MGRLTCDGTVSYRTGIGPWIRQSAGTYLVVSPLHIKTDEARCRVVFGAQALLETGPKTEVEVSQPESNRQTVVLKGGAILYAIPQEAALRIDIPQAGVLAVAGAAEPEAVEKIAAQVVSASTVDVAKIGAGSFAPAGGKESTSAFSSAAHMGVVDMTEASSVKLHNLRGQLYYRAGTESFQAVAVGGTPELIAGSAGADDPKKAPGAGGDPAEHVYYVATDGNDETGDGSQERPWATINHALDSVVEGSTVTVRPGTYTGQVRLDRSFATGVTVVSETPYRALLRHNETVVTCYNGQRITLEGFDISHSGPGAKGPIVHIQDRRGAPGGADCVSSITLKNNILHNSYGGDILTIEGGATSITVANNAFYNQTAGHAHVDVNGATHILIEDNLFFNDFAGCGRPNGNDTGSYVLIRDDNGDADGTLGSQAVNVHRNIFFNWEGSPEAYFLQIGKDGKPYHEARNILVENNLMLGNTSGVIRCSFGVQGGRDILYRHNTIAGDLPSRAYAMHLHTVGANPPNANIRFFNNIWSDPTGTMGAEAESLPDDFSDTPPGQTTSFEIDHNAYWNRKNEIPNDKEELINPWDDGTSSVGNPLLGRQTRLTPPRWNPEAGQFADGSATIRKAFRRLVMRNGAPAKVGRPVIDIADTEYAPKDDILCKARPSGAIPDIGAYEQTRLILWWLPVSGGVVGGVVYYESRDRKSPSRP